MTRFIFITGLAVSILLSMGAVSYPQIKSEQKSGTAAIKMSAQKDVYYCPMHPDEVSEKPGSCPKCGMDLQKKESTTSDIGTAKNGATKDSKPKKVTYYCPMHPNETSKKPGKCFICGMDLVKKNAKRN